MDKTKTQKVGAEKIHANRIKSEESLISKIGKGTLSPERALDVIDMQLKLRGVWDKAILKLVDDKKTGAESIDRIARNEAYPAQVRICALLREDAWISTIKNVANSSKSKVLRLAAKKKMEQMIMAEMLRKVHSQE